MVKRISSLALSLALITAFILSLSTKPAYAYIDAGTGSFLIQAMLASLFASLFAIKVFWHRLTTGVSVVFARVAQVVGRNRQAGP
jgi:hypothetical protein